MPVDPRDRLSPPWFLHSFPVARSVAEELGLNLLPGLAHVQGPDEARVSRLLSERLHSRRRHHRADERPIRAGEIAAMSLFQDILRFLVDDYTLRHNPTVLKRGRAAGGGRAGDVLSAELLEEFLTQFPPEILLDRRGEETSFLYTPSADPLSPLDTSLRELILLRLANGNPALSGYRELFDERPLATATVYRAYLSAVEVFLRSEPPHPETGMSLIDTLWAPILASPEDVEGQLAYVRKRWNHWLPASIVESLLLAHGYLREERAMRGPGPGPVQALAFGGGAAGYPEYEAFSVDRDWMPNVVLMAKSTYVWLDQLSKRYGRPIQRLDEIPDEELDLLAQWGFSSLWLIGLWERSEASRTIKRMTGNPEAEASAYSLYDYTIAGDLGGEPAYQNLAARAWHRGIRLASDMVPNHVGIFSRWTVEHPDWFIQSGVPPFPGYTFNGPDLSSDGRVSIHIEDGYWSRSDAAVVFKLHDHRDGRTRYIYHGNDGTSMPWNDTAQLNYLLPQVREAVIETILHVARMFPVIRFDAAMTLAKKHYQRLWFPKPGDAGAIPSRAEHGMSQEEFDRIFPVEFWREVVDRVAIEAPDTLLLAEAFWLMEGYFVRTLGVHRVYNSAFMNMLKMEENAKFRLTVRNVLEYSPAILQRFVNFMNNPDEDTAEAQFGKGDKYFGVATLLVTMPGLPMFGHGQVEGLTEKYGMEYRRAYRDEAVDHDLVRRHEGEIFPLMRRRHIFSGADHFAFFDFVAPEGWVNENVFAYTNRSRDERALIVFNNAFEEAHGSVRISSAINEGSAEMPRLRQRSLAETLGLDLSDQCYYIYRDCRSGLEYLEHAQRIADFGMHFHLGGYGCRALIDWRLVRDEDASWGRLHMMLAGKGVANVDEAYMEMVLAPILDPFRALIAPPRLLSLFDDSMDDDFMLDFKSFIVAVGERCERKVSFDAMLVRVEDGLRSVRGLETTVTRLKSKALRARFETFKPAMQKELLAAWALLRPLGSIVYDQPEDSAAAHVTTAAWMHEWFLTRQLGRVLHEGASSGMLRASQLRCMIRNLPGLLGLQERAWGPYLDSLASDPDSCAAMGVNRFGGRRWMGKELLEQTLGMTLIACLLESSLGDEERINEDLLLLALDDIETMEAAAMDVGYDLDWWLDALK
ncbi:MAG: hypothetical protein RLZZ303_1253 [Candidatus Hydrogenedentota bacterium]